MTIHIAEGDIAERTRSIVADLCCLEGPLLPILHEVQKAFGYVPQESLPVIAQALNLSRAEVHGVMTFYHDYRAHPAGRHVLKLCRAEACQSMGGREIADHACKVLELDWHSTTPDGRVTLEPVYCLGLCSLSPAAMIDGRLVARLDAKRLDKALEEVAR